MIDPDFILKNLGFLVNIWESHGIKILIGAFILILYLVGKISTVG